MEEKLSFWDRLADRVAEIGGSWNFIGSFGAIMVIWVLLNVVVLPPFKLVFDAYPFVFLNLILSMLAALQAPIIMMSQNRQSQKDRETAQSDLEADMRSEALLITLHAKIDMLNARLDKAEEHSPS